MDDLWKIFAGLRHCSALLQSHLGQWLPEHMVFVPAYQLPPSAESKPVWAALGINDLMLEKVAVQWQLCWSGEELQVCDGMENEPDILQEVYDFLLPSIPLAR